MNLIALFLGLVLERALTRILHLRELHWFDAYFDWGFAWTRGQGAVGSLAICLGLLVLPCLPVFFVAIYFSHLLYGIPYVAFAALVLTFSLGPRDLGREVEDYCGAVEQGDAAMAESTARELLEADAPRRAAARERALEEAVFVQANNRVFGVVFWFMILGPMGAWGFRVLDLMRRQALAGASRAGVDIETVTYLRSAKRLHWLMAWLPARLLAVGYALAGNFEHAVARWRAYYREQSRHFYEVNEELLACVGLGALGEPVAGNDESRVRLEALRAAMRLVGRTLFIWVTVISVITLFGWRP